VHWPAELLRARAIDIERSRAAPRSGGLRIDWIVTFAAAAYNLVRLRALLRPA